MPRMETTICINCVEQSWWVSVDWNEIGKEEGLIKERHAAVDEGKVEGDQMCEKVR